MELARTLHKGLGELFDTMDSRELGLWTALYQMEAAERKADDDKRALIARAESALRSR